MSKDNGVVSVAELKARLSHYIRLVRRGRRVTVTHRGLAVATLMPPTDALDDARLQRLVEAGIARAPQSVLPADFWDADSPRDPDGRSLAGLLEERAEGR